MSSSPVSATHVSRLHESAAGGAAGCAGSNIRFMKMPSCGMVSSLSPPDTANRRARRWYSPDGLDAGRLVVPFSRWRSSEKASSTRSPGSATGRSGSSASPAGSTPPSGSGMSSSTPSTRPGPTDPGTPPTGRPRSPTPWPLSAARNPHQAHLRIGGGGDNGWCQASAERDPPPARPVRHRHTGRAIRSRRSAKLGPPAWIVEGARVGHLLDPHGAEAVSANASISCRVSGHGGPAMCVQAGSGVEEDRSENAR